MDGWLLVSGLMAFIGAAIGSVITGFAVELYRQRNRLRLAAIDKRLEAYQEGFRLVSVMAKPVWRIQNLKGLDAAPQRSKERRKLERLRRYASRWLLKHRLYLDGKVGQQLGELFRDGDDFEQFRDARGAIERAAGLPSLKEDWWPFVRDGS